MNLTSRFRLPAILALLVLAWPAVSNAQVSEGVTGRLDSLGRDVSNTFGSIFGGNQGNQGRNDTRAPAAPAAPATTGAIGAKTAQMSETDALLRIESLERAVRQLTGTIEQLQYQNQQLQQQLQQMQADLGRNQQQTQGSIRPAPARPGSIPQPAPGAAPLPQTAAPPPAVGGRRPDAFDPSQNPNAPGAPRPLGSPGSRSDAGETIPGPGPVASAGAVPNTTIIADEGGAPGGVPGSREPGAPLDLTGVANAPRDPNVSNAGAPPIGPRPPGQVASVPPAAAPAPPAAPAVPMTPRQEFDLAYGHLAQKEYAQAEDGLRKFLKAHPRDGLAADAQFWLGESMFQRQSWREAADAFVGMAKKYDRHPKAPDALLRLAQSLAALHEKELACATFGEVSRKYPNASTSIRQAVEREQKRARC